MLRIGFVVGNEVNSFLYLYVIDHFLTFKLMNGKRRFSGLDPENNLTEIKTLARRSSG